MSEQEPDEAFFVDLLNGKRGPIRVALLGTSLMFVENEKEIPDDGVYELTHEEFAHICETIAKEHRSFDTALEVAQMCDEQGLAERFFRLNHAVLEWARSKKPISTFDCTIV